MNNLMSFYDRLMFFSHYQGIKNANDLAKELNYKSPEKLYRLKRDINSKPSFGILTDIANKFEFLNLRWLLVGKGEMLIESNSFNLQTKEANPCVECQSKNTEIKTHLKTIEILTKNYERQENELAECRESISK
ncbi:MAG: hypothetical protein RIG77_00730 [Cyclobacteriaceae bacterium]